MIFPLCATQGAGVNGRHGKVQRDVLPGGSAVPPHPPPLSGPACRNELHANQTAALMTVSIVPLPAQPALKPCALVCRGMSLSAEGIVCRYCNAGAGDAGLCFVWPSALVATVGMMRRHRRIRHGGTAALSSCVQLRWIRRLSLAWPQTQVCVPTSSSVLKMQCCQCLDTATRQHGGHIHAYGECQAD